jgi:hypothetical protein
MDPKEKPDRNKLPSRQKIAEYWRPRVEEFGVFDALQGDLPEDECWACGNAMRIERCHIQAYMDGGGNTVDNLVLLCSNCHTHSETLPRDRFWLWVRNTREKRWKPPVLHSLDRMEDYGYDLDTMRKKIEELGTDGLAREMGLALGVLKKNDLQ